jgi:hypothetical protein
VFVFRGFRDPCAAIRAIMISRLAFRHWITRFFANSLIANCSLLLTRERRVDPSDIEAFYGGPIEIPGAGFSCGFHDNVEERTAVSGISRFSAASRDRRSYKSRLDMRRESRAKRRHRRRRRAGERVDGESFKVTGVSRMQTVQACLIFHRARASATSASSRDCKSRH